MKEITLLCYCTSIKCIHELTLMELCWHIAKDSGLNEWLIYSNYWSCATEDVACLCLQAFSIILLYGGLLIHSWGL